MNNRKQAAGGRLWPGRAEACCLTPWRWQPLADKQKRYRQPQYSPGPGEQRLWLGTGTRLFCFVFVFCGFGFFDQRCKLTENTIHILHCSISSFNNYLHL